jgi:hypothetical protein
MHIYLLVTEDDKEAYVYSNLKNAKDKDKELINNRVYEWVSLWCRPLDYQSDDTFTDLSSVWLQLEKSYNQGNWNTKAKYPKDIMENIKLKNKELYIV